MKVVIVGGGFGGVKAALELAKDKKISVTLISDKDHFLFYPTLYSTATGRSRQQSVLPMRDILPGKRIAFVQDTVVSVDTTRKMVIANNHQLPYDRVIFALGVVTSYFGISGLDTYSYSIKSSTEIDRFKKHLHEELTKDKHLDKNYIVVGAGPTGVELSASLADYIKKIALNHQVGKSKVRISLVEAAPRVLPRLSERSSEMVSDRLKHVGIRVMTDKRVQSEDDDSIIISGKDIPTKTAVWTSGVANHPFFSDHQDIFKLAKNGRVEVDEHLRASDKIFVIGDNANTTYTGLAQTAIHDAVFVSSVIRAEVHKETPPRYKPKKQPIAIPVGSRWALMEYGPVRLTGLFGHLIHRAASFIGYTDYFPLHKAIALWLSETKNEEDCPVCW